MEGIRNLFNKYDIKYTTQREVIFDYLYKNRNHPTADKIYKALSPEMAGLSKTTIYNTMKLFAEKGLITVINTNEQEARFDANTSNHGHFVCKRCGNLFDVNTSHLSIPELEGFRIDNYQINLNGYCRVCNFIH
jgi:Fe2+ or Zn2+ uptake regulation protein